MVSAVRTKNQHIIRNYKNCLFFIFIFTDLLALRDEYVFRLDERGGD